MVCFQTGSFLNWLSVIDHCSVSNQFENSLKDFLFGFCDYQPVGRFWFIQVNHKDLCVQELRFFQWCRSLSVFPLMTSGRVGSVRQYFNFQLLRKIALWLWLAVSRIIGRKSAACSTTFSIGFKIPSPNMFIWNTNRQKLIIFSCIKRKKTVLISDLFLKSYLLLVCNVWLIETW